MPAKPRDPETEPAETPHYHGHRERLRERFYNAGPDALSDYELLEMALFAALPRRDTKPLAKSLLKKFGSFRIRYGCSNAGEHSSHSAAGLAPLPGDRCAQLLREEPRQSRTQSLLSGRRTPDPVVFDDKGQ